jgi:hypothetical protein
MSFRPKRAPLGVRCHGAGSSGTPLGLFKGGLSEGSAKDMGAQEVPRGTSGRQSPIAARCQRPVRCARYSSDLLSPSPPAEKATARQQQAGKARTDNGQLIDAAEARL